MSHTTTDQIIGEDASRRFAASAAAEIRAHIAEAGGREVFLEGRLDAQGCVESVRVIARGTQSAVPAFIEGVAKGSVVIHNHPSGDIGPSEPDLELATVFGFNGLGVYIVDNPVERVYVVVEPLVETPRPLLDAERLAALLGPDGPLAKILPQYEQRPQQVAMLRDIARVFDEEGIGVIEAPTGVGKTMAYLLPAVEYALQNRERVVISTRTINLQEQIMEKDVPALAQCFDRPFHAVLVKGRGNYLCRRRFARALSEATLFSDAEDAAVLQKLADWAETTRDGSLSDLPFVPPRGVWERVCSEADACAFTHCADFAKCFVSRARRELAKADLIVANHHMLFSDLAIKREMDSFSALAVLPAYRRVILDEAHNIEDSATEYLGSEVTRNGAIGLIGRFVHFERGMERGLLPFIKLGVIRSAGLLPREAANEMLGLIDNQLMPALASAREGLDALFASVRSHVAERCGQVGRDIKWRLTAELLRDPELREIHSVCTLPVVEELQACANHCAALLRRLKTIPPEEGETESHVAAEMVQLDAYRRRLQRLAANLAEATSAALPANTVRWVEIDGGNPSIVRIHWCHLDVGQPLSEWVYPNLKSVVMTSATMAVQGRFDYLRARLGIDRVEGRLVHEVALGTPFDYHNQALLCIATDLPAPDQREFLDESETAMARVLSITRGHALILFTSFYALDHAYRALEPGLRAAGIVALKQGGAARTQLLDRFRRDASSVLFATDSFWEGVDVAGDALQCVLLPKLPFRVPSEPILEARAEAIDEAGGNSFMEYSVPQAVIKLRQGFGRLIRRQTDRGAIVMLDKRVVTKRYGRMFLDSLPGARTVKGDAEEVLAELAKFFER